MIMNGFDIIHKNFDRINRIYWIFQIPYFRRMMKKNIILIIL